MVVVDVFFLYLFWKRIFRDYGPHSIPVILPTATNITNKTVNIVCNIIVTLLTIMLLTIMLQYFANQQTTQKIATKPYFNKHALTASHTAYWRSLVLEKPVVNTRFCRPRNATFDAFEP